MSDLGAVRRAAMQRIAGALSAIGRLSVRAADFWRSVRPTTRRGAVLGLIVTAGAASLLAVVLFVGATVAWSPYLESVVRPDTNARTWAALEPTYTRAGLCAGCHDVEARKAATASHAGIGCESCHGALREHALASPGTPELTAELATPTDEVCVRCHAAAAGRPEGLRQIVPAEHYVAECLQCHDPHTAISRRPPVVLHSLEKLPPCVTCHGPEGFKARNQRHPQTTSDEPCLDCHAPGRGPEGR